MFWIRLPLFGDLTDETEHLRIQLPLTIHNVRDRSIIPQDADEERTPNRR